MLPSILQHCTVALYAETGAYKNIPIPVIAIFGEIVAITGTGFSDYPVGQPSDGLG